MTNPSAQYDVIIIGGGTAGCTLAARLSENPDRRVLLIEAGPNRSHPFVSTPTGVGMLWKKRLFEWGFDCQPCDGLNGRSIEVMRGKILGGSSAINAMMHVRGAPGDFDRWAEAGRPGWDYASVEPYFRQTETWRGPPHARRGADGPVTVSPADAEDPMFDAWIEAAQSAGHPVMDDYNALAPGEKLHGFTRNQQSVGDGFRVTAKTSYLDGIASRPNLAIRSDTRVLKLLLDPGDQGRVTARGVRIAGENGGAATDLFAADRLILSAGAFHTPHLLMLSGIGPEDGLKAAGILPVLKSEHVGSNYQDHMAVQIRFERTDPGPFHAALRMDRLAVNFPRAALFGTGPSTVVPSGIHGFLHTHRDDRVPTFQFIFRGAPTDAGPWWPILSSGFTDGFGIRPVILHPKSRGEVRLADNDPRSLPIVEGRFLEHPDDMDILYEGVEIAREMSIQPAMKHYIRRTIDDFGNDKAATLQWMRDTAVTVHHPCGTCAMGPDDEHPVDPDLNVKGCDNLSVVDASVMPGLVSGNINACVYMIAEKFAAEQTEETATK